MKRATLADAPQRRIQQALAGRACGAYLARVTPGTAFAPAIKADVKSSALADGVAGSLDPLIWPLYLNGSFVNTPALRPRVAFFAPRSLQAAQEHALHAQAAAAVADAEARLRAFAAPPRAEAGAPSQVRSLSLLHLQGGLTVPPSLAAAAIN